MLPRTREDRQHLSSCFDLREKVRLAGDYFTLVRYSISARDFNVKAVVFSLLLRGRLHHYSVSFCLKTNNRDLNTLYGPDTTLTDHSHTLRGPHGS